MARSNARDLQGLSQLLVTATLEVVNTVESMHRTIGGGPAWSGRPLERPVRLFAGAVYATIRGVTRWVGDGLELALEQWKPWLGEGSPGIEREAWLAALNGVIGDHLQATGNPLALPTTLRLGEERALWNSGAWPLSSGALERLLVLVHGSSMNARQWLRRGHDHGVLLARELRASAIYLDYNSGLHVAHNGREFAQALEALVASWPVPVRHIDIVAHSMGGLVSRSACHVAEEAGHRWRELLGALFTLGTPHHGAPLERGGNVLETVLGWSDYSAPIVRLGRMRSAGITDLRYGHVLDEGERDRFAARGDARTALPLPAGVTCGAIAASTSKCGSKRLRGDGLVPVDSALGRHRRTALQLDFAPERQWVAYETDHLGLLDSAAVCATLRRWLVSQGTGGWKR